MKLNLCILGIFIAALSVIFMGCLHEDENSSLTNQLAATEAELSSVQADRDALRGELSDSQVALLECQGTGLGVLKITNNYSSAIGAVYIYPTTSDEWGRDWTWETGTISAFYSQYYVLDPGTYDLRVVFSNGQELVSEITISPGEITTQGYE